MSILATPLHAGDTVVLSPECLGAVLAPESHRPSLVAVLSPRMVYSVTEWPRMKAAAADEGLGIVAWWSPDLTDNEIAAAAAKAGWTISDMAGVTRMPAGCVGPLGHANHYPYSLVLGRGQVHPWPIWGVMPDQAWVESLRWRLSGLKQPLGSHSP